MRVPKSIVPLLAAVALTIGVGGTAAAADTPSRLSRTTADPTTGGLAGTVTDSAGRPVTGAVVTPYSGSGYGTAPTATTGADGSWRIEGLAPQGYPVCVSPPAPTAGTGLLTACWRGGSEPDFDHDAAVRAGQTTLGIDVVLPEAAAVSGRVTDAAGSPLGGAAISATGVGDPEATTAADGGYVVRGLEPGTTTVCVTLKAYVGQCWQGVALGGAPSNIALRAGRTTPDIDVALSTGDVVTGRVRGTDGTPVGGLDLTASGPSSFTHTTSAGDGAFTFSGLGAGSTTICAPTPGAPAAGAPTGYQSGCTTLTVHTGLTQSRNLALTPAGGVRGRVTDPSHRPVAGVDVSVAGAPTVASTDADGRWQVTGVTPGQQGVCYRTYDLPGVRQTQFADQCLDAGTSGAPDVTAGSFVDLTEQLQPLGVVTGTVRDATGAPAAGVNVYAQGLDSGSGGQAFTGADGTYRISGLFAGRFQICGDHLQLQDRACFGGTVDPTPVRIHDGKVTSGIDLSLPSLTALAGRVTDADGHGLAGVTLVLSNPSAGYFSLHPDPTDSDGRYVADLPAAGDWTVCAYGSSQVTAPTGGDSTTGYLDACWHSSPTDGRPTPTPVSVAAGETVDGVDVVQQSAAGFGGRVTDGSGRPLPGAEVSVTGVDGYPSVEADTDADGRYLVQDLTPGDYRVCTYAGAVPGSSSTGYYRSCLGDDGGPDSVSTTNGKARQVDTVLRAATGVIVHVTDPRGRPIPGALVDGDGQTRTDADGRYGFAAPDGGDVSTCVFTDAQTGGSPLGYRSRCGSVHVEPGLDAELDIVLQPAAALSGVVRDSAGNPLSDVSVEVTVLDFEVRYATTDARGRWSTRGFDPGSAVACFTPGTGTGTSPTSYLAVCTAQTIGLGRNRPLTTVLAPGGGVVGTVRDAFGPLVGGHVSARSLDDSGIGRSATVAADGRYLIAGLPSGSYEVCFARAYGGDVACWRNVHPGGHATPVPVVAGTVTTGIDAALPKEQRG